MNLKEKLFCQFYTTYQLPKEAAIKAGYSETIAERKAQKLLNKTEIQQEIKKIKNEIDNKQLICWATTVLKRIIFDNPNDAIILALKSEEATEQKIEQMNLFTVSEFKKFKDGSLEIKFINKLKAIKSLVEITHILKNSSEANNFLDALTNSSNPAAVTTKNDKI